MAEKILMPAAGEFDADMPNPGAAQPEEDVPAWVNEPAREPAAKPAPAIDDDPWAEENAAAQNEGRDLAIKRAQAQAEEESRKAEFKAGWGLSPDPVEPVAEAKSAEPDTFAKAFAAARASGADTFSWRGKAYTTKTRAAGKKRAPVGDAVSRRLDAAARAAAREDIERMADVGSGKAPAAKPANVVGNRAPDRPVSPLAKATTPAEARTERLTKPPTTTAEMVGNKHAGMGRL